MDLKQYLHDRATLVDEALQKLMPTGEQYPAQIHQAMQYSVFAGGKRLRPILCLAAAEAVGKDYTPLLPAACALEMIHTYSLIHDDLPAMDNDDYRRGKLTNHKVYGEGMAVLAGDALLTYAFEVLARFGEAHPEQKRVWQVMCEIAVAAGTGGMIGGQTVDLQSEGQVSTEERFSSQDLLLYIHTHKTGALFRAALRTGALLAGADEQELNKLTVYAEKFGLAFQITDDLLDIMGQQEIIGKPVGSDAKNGKLTYPALWGLEESKRLVQAAIDEAVHALKGMSGYTEPLELLIYYLAARKF